MYFTDDETRPLTDRLKRCLLPWLLINCLFLLFAMSLSSRNFELALIALFVSGYLPILLISALPAVPSLQFAQRQIILGPQWLLLIVWEAAAVILWLLLRVIWPAQWPVANAYVFAVVVLIGLLVTANLAVEKQMMKQEEVAATELEVKKSRIQAGRAAINEVKELNAMLIKLKSANKDEADEALAEIGPRLSSVRLALLTLKLIRFVEGPHNLDDLESKIETALNELGKTSAAECTDEIDTVKNTLDVTMGFFNDNGYIWDERVKTSGTAR